MFLNFDASKEFLIVLLLVDFITGQDLEIGSLFYRKILQFILFSFHFRIRFVYFKVIYCLLFHNFLT